MRHKITILSCGFSFLLLVPLPVFSQSDVSASKASADVAPIITVVGRNKTRTDAINSHCSYSELSTQDRAVLHGQWESIAIGDEPPYPVGGLQPLSDEIQVLQAVMRADGLLVFVANVNSDGDVSAVTLLVQPNGNVTATKFIEHPNESLTSLVLRQASRTKFKPASCKGVPCAMEFPFRFQFEAQ